MAEYLPIDRLLTTEARASLDPAAQLRAWYGAAGLTAASVADELEVGRPFLSRVLNGVRPMPRDKAERLEKLTSIPASLWETRSVGDG
ncbi:MAG: helix-turn-helix transcriptional regulator [Acidobacteriota bacterium]